MIKAVIFDKDGVLLDLEATWLNSAIAMTHFIAGLTDGRHSAETFQDIIGIDENPAALMLTDFLRQGLWLPSLAPLPKLFRN